MNAPIRIVIADDHPLFRAGLRALLESVADTEVVGEAATGEEAVEIALALTPDVVVMDINMPGLNGIDATRGILDESEDINILVMTMHDDDEAVFAAIRAGARGYQLKGAAQDETLRAILDTSGQMLYFTAGEKEVRTWMLRKGGTALEAADNIHSDLARGFIRAEIMCCKDLVRLGSEREVKAANLVRQEPKDYVVQDDDILNIRFSV